MQCVFTCSYAEGDFCHFCQDPNLSGYTPVPGFGSKKYCRIRLFFCCCCFVLFLLGFFSSIVIRLLFLLKSFSLIQSY